jgi:pseudouridine synthase
MKIILQKIIAQSGYSSRREAERLIRAGAVKVNGQTAVVGQTADPDKDRVTVKNKLIGGEPEKIYIKLNKPAGYVSTSRAFPGEQNIFDLVRTKERLFAVGRLDKESRGLMLLTNDGELTQRLTHPRFEHDKIYEVRATPRQSRGVQIGLSADQVTKKLRAGVDIGEGDGLARAKDAKYLQNGLFVITLNEGKKREIRRLFKAVGLETINLKRISLAGLTLGNLAEGKWTYLNKEEINNLKKV